MSIAKKIANAKHEEEASYTTRSLSKHGIGKSGRRIKKVRNRAARRLEAELAFRDES